MSILDRLDEYSTISYFCHGMNDLCLKVAPAYNAVVNDDLLYLAFIPISIVLDLGFMSFQSLLEEDRTLYERAKYELPVKVLEGIVALKDNYVARRN